MSTNPAAKLSSAYGATPGTSVYRFRVVGVAKVIDGDTFDLDLDLGFHARLRVRVRLAGIDTYEVYGVNAHPDGPAARQFAADWLTARVVEPSSLVAETFRLSPGTPTPDGSFGRWAAVLVDTVTGANLAEDLRTAGYEKP